MAHSLNHYALILLNRCRLPPPITFMVDTASKSATGTSLSEVMRISGARSLANAVLQ